MAIALEFNNAIVLKSAIVAKYPGGLQGFVQQDLANYVEDDHLVRVGFMGGDVCTFIEELIAAGLLPSDVALVTSRNQSLPSWLSVGTIEGHFACWRTDEPPGRVRFFEPGFILRCPRTVYDRIDDIGRQCDVQIVQSSNENREGALDKLQCNRGDAMIEIVVIEGRNAGEVGLWAQRDISRLVFHQLDCKLVQDLQAVLLHNGAEVP